MRKLSLREKSVLAGLYLSKFDAKGLHHLGFDTFIEAFNVIGLALGVQPASVKNYRDEFDPLFPNGRMGWHKRPIRAYCKTIYDAFNGLGIEEFSVFLKKIIYKKQDLDVLMEDAEKKSKDSNLSFAKRLITGQAAEEYFRSKFQDIDQFKNFELEDTTRLGCGFDFRVFTSDIFFGVEVKGLNESSGNILLTNKEHSVASILKDRYFLFVVCNFREKPSHTLYQNPLESDLTFTRVEQRSIQVNWTANV